MPPPSRLADAEKAATTLRGTDVGARTARGTGTGTGTGTGRKKEPTPRPRGPRT